MRYLSETHLKLKSCEVSFAPYLLNRFEMLTLNCTAEILTQPVQNIKNMSKLKGISLTNEILRDFILRWVSNGNPHTLDSPVGPSYIVSRVSNLVWLRFVPLECFYYYYCSRIWSPAQIFEIHRWSILLISISLILMIAPLHIFMLYKHPSW